MNASICHPDIDISQLAKMNNWFVNGLNYTHSGENYQFQKLNYFKNKIKIIVDVTSIINKHTQETLDFSSIVSRDKKMFFTPKFDISQKIHFSLFFNMIVNSLFIYVSWDNPSIDKNRFILGSKISYSGKDLLLKE